MWPKLKKGAAGQKIGHPLRENRTVLEHNSDTVSDRWFPDFSDTCRGSVRQGVRDCLVADFRTPFEGKSDSAWA